MKTLFSFIIVVSTVFQSALASELLYVDAKIYKADSAAQSTSLTELLSQSTLEHNPRFLAEYEKQVGIKFDFGAVSNEDLSILEVAVLSSESTKTYSIDINVNNGESKTISSIQEHPIGEPFIVSTVIDNVSRIIKIDIDEYSTDLEQKLLVEVTPKADVATYILEVASNLRCEELAIEVMSDTSKDKSNLTYSSSAYASISLAPGQYVFGDVICRNNDEEQSLDLLREQLTPFTVTKGDVFYGGKLILQQRRKNDIRDRPDVLRDCPYVRSRARGGSGSGGCIVAEVTSSPSSRINQIQAFAPPVEQEDIDMVNSALGLPNTQLIYLPLMR